MKGLRQRYLGWSHRKVESVKAEVRRELDQLDETSNTDRFKLLQLRIDALQSSDDDEDRLRLFVYLMHILILQERTLYLDTASVRAAFELAQGVLTAQGLEAEYSELSFLYADLLQIRSQIHRRMGNHWQSLWDHQMAGRYLPEDSGSKLGNHTYALANRQIRFGSMALGIALLRQCEPFLRGKPRWFTHQLHMIQGMRLLGDFTSAHLASDLLGQLELTEPIRTDLTWEKGCIEASQGKSPEVLLAKVRKGLPHYHSEYVILSAIWALAHSGMQWLKRLPKLSNLPRRESLNPRQHRLLYKTAVTIQTCYDYDIPLPRRLQMLGAALEDTTRLITIEQECLVWLAATRFLSRARVYDMASTTLSAYEALSRRMTSGGSSDVIGFATDLLEANWLRDHRPSISMSNSQQSEDVSTPRKVS